MLHNVSQEPRTITTYVLVINLYCRRIFNYVESQQVETQPVLFVDSELHEHTEK